MRYAGGTGELPEIGDQAASMATVVAFHAHPDDEVLLTGGTLARLAAEGHRVVIVVATDGVVRPRVHQAGARAAELAGIRVLEGTAPRELITLLFTPVRLLGLVAGHHRADIRLAFTPRSAITHRISVRRFAAQKQAALAAHTSCTRGQGRSSRLARLLLALPAPFFGLLLGWEWFAEPGAVPARIRTGLFRPAPAMPRRRGRGAV